MHGYLEGGCIFQVESFRDFFSQLIWRAVATYSTRRTIRPSTDGAGQQEVARKGNHNGGVVLSWCPIVLQVGGEEKNCVSILNRAESEYQAEPKITTNSMLWGKKQVEDHLKVLSRGGMTGRSQKSGPTQEKDLWRQNPSFDGIGKLVSLVNTREIALVPTWTDQALGTIVASLILEAVCEGNG